MVTKKYVFLPSGDAIYVRVMVDPVQNLGDSFICNIEKVFLCTGTDGYVPKYNPSNFEFGCLADAPSLLYRFKIIVSEQNYVLYDVMCFVSIQILTVTYLCLTPGQGPARDTGSVIWQRGLQLLTGGGWPWSFRFSETTWFRWFQNGFLSSFPGQSSTKIKVKVNYNKNLQ